MHPFLLEKNTIDHKSLEAVFKNIFNTGSDQGNDHSIVASIFEYFEVNTLKRCLNIEIRVHDEKFNPIWVERITNTFGDKVKAIPNQLPIRVLTNTAYFYNEKGEDIGVSTINGVVINFSLKL